MTDVFHDMYKDENQLNYNGNGLNNNNIINNNGAGVTNRKSLIRKCVDPNSTIINYIIMRKYARDFRDIPSLNPHSSYKRYLLPPAVFYQNDFNDCIATRFCRSSINKQRCPVNCLSWTPEGRRLITGNSAGEFTLWNGLAFNFETILQAHDEAVRAMVWNHNENWFVTADHGGVIKYWQTNMSNVRLLQGHREPVRGLTFSPTDFKFASCSDDASIKLWDFESGQEEKTLTGHGWDVKTIDYHPQKAIIASGSKDNVVKLWDPKRGKCLTTLHGHKNTVMQVKWNQNGNWLVSVSRDQLIKIYDIRQMKELITMKGHNREVTCVAWHPKHESLFLTGSFNGSLMYWKVGLENTVATIESAHENAIWDIKWHPVGHVVATASTKFWSRNRPGDTMNDRYNRNTSDHSSLENEMVEIAPSRGGDIMDGNLGMLPGLAKFDTSVLSGVDAATLMKQATDSINTAQQLYISNVNININNVKAGRRRTPDNYVCNRCGNKGHWIDECPTKDQTGGSISPNAEPKIPPDGYICKRCCIPGHYLSDCTMTKPPPPNYTCHKCRLKGHWKQDCPLLNASNKAEQKIDETSDQINGSEQQQQQLQHLHLQKQQQMKTQIQEEMNTDQLYPANGIVTQNYSSHYGP